MLLQPLFEVCEEGIVTEPAGGLSVLPVRPQLGNDQIGCLSIELLCPLVAGAGDECAHHAGLPQQRDGLFRRCLLPRVVVVMDVGVEEREFSMAAPSWYARR